MTQTQMQIDLDRLPASRMLNWEQCCAVLGCGKTHFYDLVNRGELVAVRNGTRKGIRVRAEDLRGYLAGAIVES